MIEINNITLSYDNNKILNNISYKFEKGKIYGLIGKNGAGKSSLLKSISRLNRDCEGEVSFKGSSIKNKDYLELPITFIGDTPVYYQDLTVREHLLLICSIKKIPKKNAIIEITTLLELLKLEKYKNYFPKSLSRGTLQRLNIAIGIISNEDLILMDEPFITLDPVQVTIIENLILKYKKENKTFIISSHDIDSLESICDCYLILKDGKLLEYDPKKLNKKNISKIIDDSYGEQ